MQENNERVKSFPVTVRAWGDEPVRLFLHRIENNRCYVGNERSVHPIGLPIEQVFAFDMDTFTGLSTAFQQGDVGKLGELWANLGVDDFACNKYKISLECSHDQEHIADPESAPSSDTR